MSSPPTALRLPDAPSTAGVESRTTAVLSLGRGASPLASVMVAQLGARMHYAVPRIFQEAGSLDRLCTDLCASKGLGRAVGWLPERARPRALHRLAGRVPLGVPADRITTFSGFGLAFALRQARARSPSEVLAVHLWAGRRFAELARDHGLGRRTAAVYCFNSAGLELMRAAAGRGLRSVVEQTIAPRAIGEKLLGEEHAAFPGWERPLPDAALTAALAARESAEWAVADLVLCGSDFVREGIAACGGPTARCVVVPYGVDGAFAHPGRRVEGRHLNVLAVGEVGLRKGAPYVADAARRAGGSATIRMVGGTSLTPAGRAAVAAHVELTGPIPRAQIHAQYRWADVFLLPSLYEGSATVIYEALAAGLPVICTPNAGSIVRDGVDGFVVPIRDAAAVADRLERLRDPALRAAMSANAVEGARAGRLAAYRDRLLAAMAGLAAAP